MRQTRFGRVNLLAQSIFEHCFRQRLIEMPQCFSAMAVGTCSGSCSVDYCWLCMQCSTESNCCFEHTSLPKLSGSLKQFLFVELCGDLHPMRPYPSMRYRFRSLL